MGVDKERKTLEVNRCLYAPHSLQATIATLLLGVEATDRHAIRWLLRHKNITAAQIDDR